MARSHNNDTHLFNKMTEKVKELSESQQNTITAGVYGEQVLFEYADNDMLLRRLPDDPLAVRISIGEANLSVGGTYCVFRGDPERAKKILTRSLNAIKRHFPDI